MQAQRSSPIQGRLSKRRVKISEKMARLLVVDDNKHGAHATSARLEADGFDVKVAYGGIQAMDVLRVWIPHIVLLDINMPEFNGFAVASMIRAIISTSHIGIIAMTGYDEATLRRQGSLDAFDGYFRRADNESDLMALIVDILDR